MCSDLLFYLRLAIYLINNVFVINPYDLWVAKKLVKRKARTVVWHVDNLKVSHKELFEVTKISQYLLNTGTNSMRIKEIYIIIY